MNKALFAAILLVSMLINIAPIHAQVVEIPEQLTEKSKDEEKPYVTVEQMPQYPGGERAMSLYIYEHIRIYPDDFTPEEGIQTRITIRFIVEKNGDLSNIQIVRGMSAKIDKRAYEAVKAMPKWEPGKQDGKPVRVYFTLPIRFNLRNFEPKYD